MFKTPKRLSALLAIGVASVALVACGGGDDTEDPGGPTATPKPRLSGSVSIAGSSTVYPISEAVAEEFIKDQAEVKVTVGLSGTGGGFTKFCNGEIDISDASRPISAKEMEACAAKNIQSIQIQDACDPLSTALNPQ